MISNEFIVLHFENSEGCYSALLTYAIGEEDGTKYKQRWCNEVLDRRNER